MTLAELLRDLGSRLTQAGIPFMVTGSIASSFYGEPRATRDVDFVIDPTPAALDAFVRGLPTETLHAEPDAAQEALRARGQFNVIETEGGWKADFVIRKDRPFSREEFGRRQAVELLGAPSVMASVEDVILAKLEWAQTGGSGQQLRDVAGMVAVGRGSLDLAYIERWADALELTAEWSRVKP